MVEVLYVCLLFKIFHLVKFLFFLSFYYVLLIFVTKHILCLIWIQLFFCFDSPIVLFLFHPYLYTVHILASLIN